METNETEQLPTTATANRWGSLARNITTWAELNFGNTPVSNLAVGLHADGTTFVVELNWMAPLLGMGEEYGELLKAIAVGDVAEALDAIGDIGVYFADYLGRRTAAPGWWRTPGQEATGDVTPDAPAAPYAWGSATATPLDSVSAIGVALGRLYHVELKRAQCIRGMATDNVFLAAHMAACLDMWAALDVHCQRLAGTDITSHVASVFGAVVAKRDWKKNSQNGQ